MYHKYITIPAPQIQYNPCIANTLNYPVCITTIFDYYNFCTALIYRDLVCKLLYQWSQLLLISYLWLGSTSLTVTSARFSRWFLTASEFTSCEGGRFTFPRLYRSYSTGAWTHAHLCIQNKTKSVRKVTLRVKGELCQGYSLECCYYNVTVCFISVSDIKKLPHLMTQNYNQHTTCMAWCNRPSQSLRVQSQTQTVVDLCPYLPPG